MVGPETAQCGHATVLLTDPDAGRRLYVRRILEAEGYAVSGFADPPAAQQALTEGRYDVIVLSLDPRQADWPAVVLACRLVGDVPVLVLAENSGPEAVARMLDVGVDDCLAAPFDAAELSARVARVLRVAWRHHGMASLGGSGGVQLDLVRLRARVNGREIRLTKLEYRTLCVLMQGQGALLSFPEIERRVWGDAGGAQRHALYRVVRSLRRKLTRGRDDSVRLRTVPRVGYQLCSTGEATEGRVSDNLAGSGSTQRSL